MSDTIIINYPTDEGLTINIDDNDDVIVNIIDEPNIIVNLCDDLGTTANNYDYLDNKPSINNVELVGNKTLDDLGIEPAKGADNNFVTDSEKAELHTHTNKSVLDTITSVLVSGWNAAATWVSTYGANILTHIADSSIHVTSTLLSTINNKVDKVEGKGLSTNDFTNEQKELLSQQSGVNTGDQDLSGLEPKRGADDFYITNAEKTQGALATGNAALDTVKKVADKAQYAPNENGTILYHTAKWFTPTGTISTNGTTATSTSSQFTSAMVGAKLVINVEERIITSYMSGTQVTVNSAYSQYYNEVSSNGWGVYNKAIEVGLIGARYISIYTPNSPTPVISIDTNGNFVSGSSYALYNRLQFNAGLKGGNIGNNPKIWLGDLSWITWVSGNVDVETYTKNAGIRHITDGIEIFDGNTAGVYRDLNLRNLNYYGTLNNASDERLKHDIRPVNDGLEKVCKLADCVRHFEFNNQDIYAKGQRTGFIAQLLKASGFEGHVSEREPANEEEGALFGWTYKDEEYEEVNSETQEAEIKTRRVVDVKGDMVLQVENNFSPYLYPAVAELKQQNDELRSELNLIKQKLGIS